MQEIVMHGLGADLEFSALQEALSDNDKKQSRLVWFRLTSFLSHSAMISKYLSPINPRGIKKDRMSELRDLLNVEKDSEVLSRDARDNIEHFDERIDNWIGHRGTILEIVLDSRKALKRFLREDTIVPDKPRIKRVVLLEEMIFISEKRSTEHFELELIPLQREVARITTAAQNWISTSSPYKFVYPR